MTTRYKLRVTNTSGVLQAEVTDFLDVACILKRNSPGLLTATFPADHTLVGLLQDKWGVELWRTMDYQGVQIPWYMVHDGIYRDYDRTGVMPGVFMIRCPGQMSRLGWRHVAWPAGVTNRSQFLSQKGETIMKTLVNYNAGPNATAANGRIRDGAISGITVQADGANGNTTDWYCFSQNLLKSLQDFALIAGGDFDLIKTGATAREFRWYTGQRGTDRSASVVFSLAKKNMANPRYSVSRMEEKTAIIVAGQDEGTNRNFVVRTGPNYSSTNDIELMVDARDVDNTAGLNSRGDAAAEENQALIEFTFDVVQLPGSLYDLHYFLGDLVTAVNPITGVSETRIIDEVELGMTRDAHEQIAVRTKNV